MTDDIPAFALVGIIVTPERVKRIKAVGTVPNLFATYPFYNAAKFGFYGPAMMDIKVTRTIVGGRRSIRPESARNRRTEFSPD